MSLRQLITEFKDFPGKDFLGFDEYRQNIVNHLEEFYGQDAADKFKAFDFSDHQTFTNVKNEAVGFLESLANGKVGNTPATQLEFNGILKYANEKIADVLKHRNRPELYNDAIENMLQLVENRVVEMAKNRGLSIDKTGTDLMTTVFSAENPIIKIVCPENITPRTEKDIRRGFMNLFSGSILALRNSAAHGKNIPRTEADVVRIMLFASMLMNELDKVESQEMLVNL